VLTDYAAMEAHKGDTLASIYRSMEVLSCFPAKIIVLHGTQHACSLGGDGSQFWRRMIDENQTRGFADYCRALDRARQGDTFVRRQLLDNGREATAHMNRMLADAERMSGAFDELAKTYTPQELLTLRQTDVPYTQPLLEKTARHVMMLATIHCWGIIQPSPASRMRRRRGIGSSFA
jgi:hypothetical protein